MRILRQLVNGFKTLLMKQLMKQMILFCLLTIYGQYLFSQVQITGKVVGADGGPVSLANILLLHAKDSQLVKGTMTSSSGEYVIDKVDSGSYFLRYTVVGFQDYNSPVFTITPGQNTREMGSRTMVPNNRQLQEVVVQAAKPLFQQEPDGTVINVASSVVNKGSSVLQVLERSPGIYVDHQNNNLSMNGKEGVMVMINGKLLRLPLAQVFGLLSGMSADNIEKIELLTTPPAQYDAEGSAGLINIVLKKNRKAGTNGSLSLTGGYGWGEKASASLQFSHNTNTSSLYGSYTFSHDRSYSEWSAPSYADDPVLGGPETAQYRSILKPVYDNHDATLGADFRLSPRTTIGGNVAFDYSQVSSLTNNLGQYTILPDSLLVMNAAISGNNDWVNVLNSVYFERKLKEGEKINFDFDYLYYHNNNPTNVQSNFSNGKGATAVTNNDTLFSPSQQGFANTNIHVEVLKSDYTRQLSKDARIDAGVKGSNTLSSSLSGIESLLNGAWVNRNSNDDNMTMKELIGAGYVSLTVKPSPAVNIVAGMRYEYSRTVMDSSENQITVIDRKLSELFPNLSITKKLNDHSDLQFSYSKRISRPSYNDLASYMTYNDPLSVITGNPLLLPTITNIIKAGYNYKGYAFSVLASKDDNPIVRSQFIASPSGELIYVLPVNMRFQDNLSLQANLPFKITEWWNMSYGLTGGYRKFQLEHTMDHVEKGYFAYNLNASQNFKLGRQFSMEISGWYNSAAYDGSRYVFGFGAMNAGLKKELKNNKGILQLSMTDVLKTMNIHTQIGYLTQEVFDLKNNFYYHGESTKMQIIKLSYSRSFGHVTRLMSNPDGSQEEKDRVRKGQ